jgi:hypothetical protein
MEVFMKSVATMATLLAAGSLFSQDQIRTTKTTLNGVLVDAACQSTLTERKSQNKTTYTETVECPVTSTTSSFGLVTSDGRFIRFDNPSNSRVTEIVTSKRLIDRAPRVSVLGTVNGELAVVESINPEVTVRTTDQVATDAIIFDARYHDHRGKLVVSATGVNYEDVRDADHSRRWTYGQIKELKREGNEIKIRPYSGDSFEFHVERAMSDSVYRTIEDRIVAARSR